MKSQEDKSTDIDITINKKDKFKALLKTLWKKIIKQVLAYLGLIVIGVLLFFLLSWVVNHYGNMMKLIGNCFIGLIYIGSFLMLVVIFIEYIKDDVMRDYHDNLKNIKFDKMRKGYQNQIIDNNTHRGGHNNE